LMALCELFGYTHEEAARKVGKSRSTVTEALSIAALPQDVRERCRRADITSKSLLLEIVRQPDDDSMLKVAEQIISRGATREDLRASRRARQSSVSEEGGKPFKFRFVSPKKDFRIELSFRRVNIDNSEIVAALQEVIDHVNNFS